MIIDLHIYSKHSDGVLTVKEIIREAKLRNIWFMSITDHDSIDCQLIAMDLAGKAGIRYVSGVELNVTFSHPKYHEGKLISLDFLGYQFDAKNKALKEKLRQMENYREERAAKILANLKNLKTKESKS